MTEKPKWYIISVHSGSENKVSEGILEQLEKKNLRHFVEEILIPKEDVFEVKKGVKTTTERKFFPGYVLLKMVLTDDVWHLIRGIPKVSGFLGSKSRPSPMSQSEIDRILGQVQERLERPQSSASYDVGEKVRVCDGPFVSFTGLVEEVDHEKARLKVSVSIFGRATPVDLDFAQVEKT